MYDLFPVDLSYNLDVAAFLATAFGESITAELYWIARGLKSIYAEKNNLPLERLLNDREFKDSHRPGLFKLYEELVVKDPTFEVVPVIKTIEQSTATLHIVVDLRLKPELQELERCFGHDRSKYILVHVRLVASTESRRARGVELEDVAKLGAATSTDSHVTECDLDEVIPDLVYNNDVAGTGGLTDDLVPKLRDLFKL